MGLMPDGAAHPYVRLDPQSVVGTLKATGSSDRDVLYAQKQKLLAQPKQLVMMGIILMVGGALLTLTFFAAFLGIPAAIFGWWTWNFGKKNVAAVEAGFEQFSRTVAA
jgi:hypothetical protein